MKEDLISFETAKLAKEKGFGIETLHFYTKKNSKMFGVDEEGRTYPTQSQLQKWLREKYKIHIEVGYDPYSTPDDNKKWYFNIMYLIDEPEWLLPGLQHNRWYENYEKALEKGLYQALKLIKE